MPRIALSVSIFVAMFSLLALKSTGYPKDTPALTLSVQRQVDKNGPFTASATVRTTDDSVWVKLEWAAPLSEATPFEIQWVDASGMALVKAKLEGKAGARETSSGIYIAGRPLARKPGNYTVKAFKAGETMALAQADFKLEEAVSDPNKPVFKSTLCASAGGQAEPVAPTQTFYGDNKAVWISLEAKDKIPAGHRLVPKVFDTQGELILYATPLKYDAGASRIATGFYIAGRDWAKAGGKFTFKVFWDDDPRPVAELEFKIQTANRYALLVGIKDYPPAGPENDLAGCDVDLANMQALLKDSYGIPADHIQTLADLNATRANIEKGLLELADKAGPNDAVIFYYSGHGAQVPDLDGDEADGWDEAIVPAEVMPALITSETELNRLLTDDRLAELLRRFKTPNVTVIFDSCHSGTAVRDGLDEVEPPVQLGVSKFRHFDFGRALMRRAEEAHRNRERSGAAHPRTIGFAGKRALASPLEKADDAVGVGERFVFLASSRPWETSGCTSLGGFFTNALIEALKTSNGMSWGQIFPTVRDSVSGIRPGQNPGVEGRTRRLPFSMEEVTADAPYLRPYAAIAGAKKTAEEKAERLEEGVTGTHQALIEGHQSIYVEQVGALYDVYPRGDAQFAGKPSGRIQISGAYEEVVIVGKNGKPLGEGNYAGATILSGAVHRGDRLIPVAVPVPGVRPRVGVQYGTQGADEVKEKLKKAATTLYAALKRKDFDMPDSFKFKDVDYVIEPRLVNGQLVGFIWSSGGWRVANFGGTEDEVASKVAGFIAQRHQQVTRLIRLYNPSPAFRLTAEAETGDRVYRSGEAVNIRVEVSQPGYITVIPAGSGVEEISVFPEPFKPGAPRSFTITIAKGQQDGPLPLKILATREPLDATALKAAAAEGRVEALLTALQQKVGNGGGGNRFLSTEGWAETTVRLTIGK